MATRTPQARKMALAISLAAFVLGGPVAGAADVAPADPPGEGEARPVREGAAGAAGDAGDARSAREAASGLSTVMVTATRSPAAVLSVPASVSVLDEDELERRPVVRFGDAIADLPGIYVRGPAFGASFPGSGQAALSMRGIPRTPRTLVMLDGLPLNNALSGGVNVAGLPVGSVERVEVVRGPYSALYGGNAMGGVVHFITAGPDKPLAELQAGAGSLRQRTASLAYRDRFANGLGVTLSLGYRTSDGYEDSDDVAKRVSPGTSGTPVTGAQASSAPDGSLRYRVGTMGARPWTQETAQFALHFSPTPETKLVGGLGWAEYSVGYSRPTTFLRDAAGNPVFSGPVTFDDGGNRRLSMAETDFFTPTPSGERDLRAFVRGEHRFEGGSRLTANLGSLRHRFRFTQATPGVATYDSGPGELTDQPNERVDFDVALRAPLAENWAVVGGLALNRGTMDRKTSRLGNWREWSSGVADLSSAEGESTNTALFLQSEHYFESGVTAYVGARYDRFSTSGRVTDAASGFDEAYAQRSFEQLSPKLALVWEATRWLSLRASYGQGFRPPALLDLYSRTVVPTSTAGIAQVILPSPQLGPERVASFELGADVVVAGAGTASLSLYSQRLTDLIYRRSLTERLGRNENAGEARVDGVEASVRWPTPLRGLLVFGAATHHFRYEITRNDAVPDSVGKDLTDVPATVWSLGVEFDRAPWSGWLSARHTSHVFGSGNDLNTNTVQGVYGSYDRHTVVSGKLGYRFDRHLSASLAVDNLLDRRYFVFYRQPPRTFLVEVAYRF
jgi:iron complex outermembrane receptor protein